MKRALWFLLLMLPVAAHATSVGVNV